MLMMLMYKPEALCGRNTVVAFINVPVVKVSLFFSK